jgi:transcriptional regulator with GAF, ATPase, and Fis domain
VARNLLFTGLERRTPTSLTTGNVPEYFPLASPSGSAAFQLPAQGLVFEELERELVRQALERTGGNQTRAAKLLGMTRDQIRYRIRKFSLGPTGDGGPRPEAAPEASPPQGEEGR